MTWPFPNPSGEGKECCAGVVDSRVVKGLKTLDERLQTAESLLGLWMVFAHQQRWIRVLTIGRQDGRGFRWRFHVQVACGKPE